MSDRSEKPFELARDGLGILLFTAGAFMAVLVALALASSEPLEKAEGTAAIARLWAASVGLLPGLLFSSGCALVGARVFLSGDRASARAVGRVAIVAIACSVLLGAFSKTAGGWIGESTAGAIARGSSVYLAALAGLAALGAAVWFARPRRSLQSGGTAASSTDAAGAPEDDGVSPEEAAELIPFELPRSSADPRMVSPVTEPTSPDTPAQLEDVRLRARSLSPTHEPSPVTIGPSPLESFRKGFEDEFAAPTLHERPADPEAPLSADRVDEDLALEEEPFRLDDDEAPFELVEPESELDLIEPELELETLPSDALEPASAELEPESEESAPEIEPEPSVEPRLEPSFEPALETELELEPVPERDPMPARSEVVSVPRPSWEQTSLFDVEEEPAVDAYGTPLGEPEKARKTLLRELETANETLATEIGGLEPASEDDEGAKDVVLTPAPSKRKRTKVRDPKPAAEPSDRDPKPASERPRREPAKATEPARRQPKASGERSRLLTEIGCLLVERGRVAVSMLQKQYDMDFDEATRVLDELQELGLIGPYLGGQRRDILLTRDEWMEKVSSL